MRLISLAALALALFVSTARGEFTFIHVSDIHVGASIPGGGPPHADIDARLFREMAALDSKPAFIVNTGDVCEIGGDHAQRP